MLDAESIRSVETVDVQSELGGARCRHGGAEGEGVQAAGVRATLVAVQVSSRTPARGRARQAHSRRPQGEGNDEVLVM